MVMIGRFLDNDGKDFIPLTKSARYWILARSNILLLTRPLKRKGIIDSSGNDLGHMA
jgi:hypothetical protein